MSPTTIRPTEDEIELLLAIRDLKRFEKIEIELNDGDQEVKWQRTSKYRQVYKKPNMV